MSNRTYAIFGTDHDGNAHGFMYLIDAERKVDAFWHFEKDVGVVTNYESFTDAMDDHVIREVPEEHWEEWRDASGLHEHPPMDTLR